MTRIGGEIFYLGGSSIYSEDQSVFYLGLLMRDIWQGIMGVVEWLWSPGPTDAVQEFFGYGWLWFFDLLALLGTVYAVAVVGSLALWFVGRRLTYTLLGAVALGTIVSALLWTLFSVPRPDAAGISVHTHLSVPSFPSGHTMTAMMLWGALAAFSRVPWIVPLLVVPAVMLSRLYLGAHYVGDVLASVLIGSFILVVYFLLWPPIMRWLGRWPFWLLGYARRLGFCCLWEPHPGASSSLVSPWPWGLGCRWSTATSALNPPGAPSAGRRSRER